MTTYKVDIPAGPIWNQEDAQDKAPKIAAAHQGKWTGQWKTVVDNVMSVIEVELQADNTGDHDFITDVIAGPIFSDVEAKKVGNAIAASFGAEFTGQWRTIVEGKMSIIQIKYVF